MANADELALCPADLELYQNNEWVLYKELNSDPTDPDNALHIQELKDELQEQGTPSFIKSSYFEDGSHNIITRFQLFCSK